MGLAAIDDLDVIRRFADTARREYVAVGIRAALHPQVDLPTEARWGRQAQTFGYDAQRVAEITAAYLEGFQGARLGPQSVACTTKHFPGGGRSSTARTRTSRTAGNRCIRAVGSRSTSPRSSKPSAAARPG